LHQILSAKKCREIIKVCVSRQILIYIYSLIIINTHNEGDIWFQPSRENQD